MWFCTPHRIYPTRWPSGSRGDRVVQVGCWKIGRLDDEWNDKEGQKKYPSSSQRFHTINETPCIIHVGCYVLNIWKYMLCIVDVRESMAKHSQLRPNCIRNQEKPQQQSMHERISTVLRPPYICYIGFVLYFSIATLLQLHLDVRCMCEFCALFLSLSLDLSYPLRVWIVQSAGFTASKWAAAVCRFLKQSFHNGKTEDRVE